MMSSLQHDPIRPGLRLGRRPERTLRMPEQSTSASDFQRVALPVAGRLRERLEQMREAQPLHCPERVPRIDRLAFVAWQVERAYGVATDPAWLRRVDALSRGALLTAKVRIRPDRGELCAAAAVVQALEGTPVHLLRVNGSQHEAGDEVLATLCDACGVSHARIGDISTEEQRRRAYASMIVEVALETVVSDWLLDRQRFGPGGAALPDRVARLAGQTGSPVLTQGLCSAVLAPEPGWFANPTASLGEPDVDGFLERYWRLGVQVPVERLPDPVSLCLPRTWRSRKNYVQL